jgi:glycosyltransferase involved in cell wall biosynthesis
MTVAASKEIGVVAKPPISVVICAHTEKRWNETCAAVESVRAQSYPSQEIIVVVDHNPALATSLDAALRDVRVVENREERGLSGGKNTGVAIAQGDIVAFLDDDAVADPDWLKFFADSYTDPAVIGVGGLTLPNWRLPRPAWFPREFDWVVGCTYRGMPETRAPVRNLLGGNAITRIGAAVRRPGDDLAPRPRRSLPFLLLPFSLLCGRPLEGAGHRERRR